VSFFNGFIGTRPNSNSLFTGGDDREMYEKNLLSQPQDWYYRNREITYKKNENGHRCKSLDKLDLDNYILFSGCSYTEGVGVKLEKTFPYLVSRELNLDYYNLAVGGSGPDVCFYNLFNFFLKVQKLPKFLVLQMPQHTRFVIKSKDKIPPPHPFQFFGIWVEEAKNFILEGEELGYFSNKTSLFMTMILEMYKCPVIDILPPALGPVLKNQVRLIYKDYSRDLTHPGNLSNKHVANGILESIQNYYKYNNATIHTTFRGQSD
jgi:hypothetical protein